MREYTRRLVAALRRFYNAAIKLIRGFLKLYRDSLFDDLLGRLRGLWDVELNDLTTQIRAMYQRLSRTHFLRWLTTLAAATGVSADTFQALIREPWLKEEEDSRILSNIAQAGLIGGALLASIEATLRNGLRSNLSRKVILTAMTEAERIREAQAIRYATNEIEAQWAALTQQRQQAAEVAGYIWQLTVSKKPRKDHLDRVGHFYAWDNPPSDGHPGQARGCKCGAQPAFGPTTYGIPVRERYRYEDPGRRRA